MNKQYLILGLSVLLASCSHKPLNNQPNDEQPTSVVKYNPRPYVIGSLKDYHNTEQKTYSVKEIDLPQNRFDIPIEYNKDVQKWVNYFTGKGRPWMEKYLKNSQKISNQFSEILIKENLPQDLIFLSMAESGFQQDIISRALAVGAWQFMPFTGKRYGLEVDFFYDERRDPEKSALAATRYLKDLYEMFGSWELAMAAYNAGEGKIGRAIKKYKTNDFWKLCKGRYLKPETKNYVPKIMALAIIGKNLEYFGFESLTQEHPEDTVEVVLPPKTDLIMISELLELDYEVLRYLNPTYVRWHTPLSLGEYKINIPKDKEQKFLQINVGLCEAKDFQLSPYKKIEQASSKYKIPLSLLKELNQESGEFVILPYRENHSSDDKMYYDLTLTKTKKEKRHRGKKNFSGPSYVVQKGDNLWSISQKLGISFKKIKTMNPEFKLVKPGDILSLK